MKYLLQNPEKKYLIAYTKNKTKYIYSPVLSLALPLDYKEAISLSKKNPDLTLSLLSIS